MEPLVIISAHLLQKHSLFFGELQQMERSPRLYRLCGQQERFQHESLRKSHTISEGTIIDIYKSQRATAT